MKPRRSCSKLGRKFTLAQKDGLAKEAGNGLNLDAETRARLVQQLGLTEQQVSGYFGSARFKARKAVSKLNGLNKASGGEDFDSEVPSSTLPDVAPNIGMKTRRSTKRKRSIASVEPLLTSSAEQRHNSASNKAISTNEKLYGSRPGMLKRKAPMRDPSLPLLLPLGHEDSMLKASPHPCGSPLNPDLPHLSRSHLSNALRSSISRLSLDPTDSSLRERTKDLSTAPTSFIPATTSSPNNSNIPVDY
ncbi:hypothetical protein IFR05_015673 [Cadophora sp. M221]|nr:hypothetical protein IFR05_015673 [Cadophora sp. M221]